VPKNQPWPVLDRLFKALGLSSFYLKLFLEKDLEKVNHVIEVASRGRQKF